MISNLANKLMNVALPTQDFPPYFRTSVGANGKVEYFGTDVRIIQYVAEKYKFKLRFMESIDTKWGSKEEDGTWNGMIGMVYRNECQFAGGAISITEERNEAIDFSWPVFDDQNVILSHVPTQLPKWQAMAWPFELNLWISVLVLYVLLLGLLWIFSKFVKTETSLSVSDSFLVISRGISMQSAPKSPMTPSFRIFFISCVFCFTFLDWAYSGSLVSNLTKPKRSKTLNTFEDLAISDFHIAVRAGTFWQKFFHGSVDEIHKKLAKKVDAAVEKKYSLARIVNRTLMLDDRKVVFFHNLMSSKVEREILYTTSKGQTFLHFSKEKISTSGLGIVMQKSFPYQKEFNAMVRRAQYFGLTLKWVDDELRETKISRKGYEGDKKMRALVDAYMEQLKEENGERTILSLKHLQGPLLMLLGGLTLSSLVFMLEYKYAISISI